MPNPQMAAVAQPAPVVDNIIVDLGQEVINNTQRDNIKLPSTIRIYNFVFLLYGTDAGNTFAR